MLARYCAQNPVAMKRLTFDRTAKAVTYRSDKSEGPTAGPAARRSGLPAEPTVSWGNVECERDLTAARVPVVAIDSCIR